MKKIIWSIIFLLLLSGQSHADGWKWGSGYKGDAPNADQVETDTILFSGLLSSADLNVQLALDTLDNVTGATIPVGLAANSVVFSDGSNFVEDNPGFTYIAGTGLSLDDSITNVSTITMVHATTTSANNTSISLNKDITGVGDGTAFTSRGIYIDYDHDRTITGTQPDSNMSRFPIDIDYDSNASNSVDWQDGNVITKLINVNGRIRGTVIGAKYPRILAGADILVDDDVIYNNAAGTYVVAGDGLEIDMTSLGTVTASSSTKTLKGVDIKNVLATTSGTDSTVYGIFIGNLTADTVWALWNGSGDSIWLGADGALTTWGTETDDVTVNFDGGNFEWQSNNGSWDWKFISFDTVKMGGADIHMETDGSGIFFGDNEHHSITADSNSLNISTVLVDNTDALEIDTPILNMIRAASTLRFSGTHGGGGSGILYEDTGGGVRYGLRFTSNVVSLGNRAANGVVNIYANSASAGAGGEVLVAEFSDTAVNFQAANITTTGIGTFGRVDVDTLQLDDNVISDSTGTISFDDENLITQGNIILDSDSNTLQIGDDQTELVLSSDGTDGLFTTSGDFKFTATGQIAYFSDTQLITEDSNGVGLERGFKVLNHGSNQAGGLMTFGKSRGSTASPTIVTDQNYIGLFYFAPYDGDQYLQTAGFGGLVNDATPANNDIKTDMFFFADNVDVDNPIADNAISLYIRGLNHLVEVTQQSDDVGFQVTGFDDVVASNVAISLDSAGDTNIAATGDLTIGDGGTTNYTQFETDGAPVFVGTAGLPYAEIYTKNSVAQLTLNDTAKVQVTSFTVDGASNNMTPDHTNDHVTVDKAGFYFVTVSATIENVAAQSHVVTMDLYKNDGATIFANVHSHRQLTGGGGDVGAVALSGIVDLAVNDTIEVWLDTNITADRIVIVEDITLSLIQIGGT